MSKILKEIEKATKVKREDGASDADHFAHLIRAATKLEEGDWDALSEDAQNWVNAGARAIKAKEDIPAPDEEEATSKKASKDEDADAPDADDDKTEDDDADDADADDEKKADADDDKTEDDDADDKSEEAPVERKSSKKSTKPAKDADDDAPAPRKGKAEKAGKAAKAEKPAKKATGGGGKRASASAFVPVHKMILRHPTWSRAKIREALEAKGVKVGPFGGHYSIVHATLRALAKLDLYYHGGKAAWKEEETGGK